MNSASDLTGQPRMLRVTIKGEPRSMPFIP